MAIVPASKIHVCFHVAGMFHAREICREIAGQVSASGLYDAAASLNYCVVGPPGRFSVDYCFGPRWQGRFDGSLDDYEYPTLRLAWSIARRDRSSVICYVHTKSASKADRRHRRAGEIWRQMMAHHVVERWRDAVDRLADADTCGAFYAELPYRHYSGNFWWARASYLATLPEPAPDPNHGPGLARLNAEVWPLSGGGSAVNLFALQRSLRYTWNHDLYRHVDGHREGR